MEKKWYKVSFYAQMTEEDIKAMNSSFYAAMEESMDIYGCEGLMIEEDMEVIDDDEVLTLELEDDSYELDSNGVVKIDKQIFDDYLDHGLINIKFLDEENQPINQYIMVAEDDEWIYCDYITSIR